MISLLQSLLDFFYQLVCWIMTALIGALNLIIASLGALIVLAVELLPDMPTTPTVPSEITTAASWVNWIFPVNTVAQIITFLIGAWVLWQAVVLLMRWAKATSQ